MNKIELRQMMLEQRKKLPAEQVRACSDKIISILINSPLLINSKTILSYMPYGNEVDLLPLNQWILDKGKGLCLPRVLNGSEMDAVQVKSLDKDLIKNRFGILEPAKEIEAVDVSKIDLILVPGLAFDWNGNRLGHGNGYYDRFLERCGKSTYTIGIAYDFQVFDNIPFTDHDIKMFAIVTETCQRNRPLDSPLDSYKTALI